MLGDIRKTPAQVARQKFTARAIRAAERAIAVPPGWWGTWRNVYGPNGEHVRWRAGRWTATDAAGTTSTHGPTNRAAAISKARRAVKER